MLEVSGPAATAQPIFYYDLGSPTCYLVAEQIMAGLSAVPEWEPVLGEQIGALEPDHDRQSLQQRVADRGMQPLRWPADWPPDTRTAMLAATYAKRVGRAVAFSLAAFRQAFAGGQDLGNENTVLIAAAACEMHPTAVLKGIGLRSVGAALDHAGARALAAGVSSLPAIQIGSSVFAGDQIIERAADVLMAHR
jgi:2-hydroxychromene-2-carboxylate isomerase